MKCIVLYLRLLSMAAAAFCPRHGPLSSSKNTAASPYLPNYCSECGSNQMVLRIPPNDERTRAVCDECHTVVYSNPKVVVACVVLNDTKQCLLAKRRIEPRKGYWGIPQGFMEHGETTREAAVREVWEETGATIQADDLTFRALYNVPGSVQLVYQVEVTEKDLEIASETTESSEIAFFDIKDLPELCFPTVQWAIDHCVSDNGRIQQKTKFYQASTDQWREFEDEVF